MKREEVPETRLSALISSKMEERGISILELARTLGITYEHVRRIVRGAGPPSSYVLKEICGELKLPLRKAEELMMVDKIWHKYGKLLEEYMGKRPGMEPLERAWDVLTDSQQRQVIGMAQLMAKEAKAVKRAEG